MKKTVCGRFVVALVLILTVVFTSMAFANDKSGSSHDEKSESASVHKEMYVDMMVMLKETMEIVKNMSHKPSEADKEKLDGMIKKLDKMISVKKEMIEKKKDDKK